jgi:hypothetical protein
MSARTWLEQLARLTAGDLARIGRLVDLLITADRGTAETAGTMLDAPPAPRTDEEGRARLEAVVRYLEGGRVRAARAAESERRHRNWLERSMRTIPRVSS